MFGRAVSRALQGKVTASTGIANAREALIEAYKKSLNDAKAIPEDYPYRPSVEAFVQRRLRVVEEERDVEAIETRLGVGPIEDILAEARTEHLLIANLVERKPWVEKKLDELVLQHWPEKAWDDLTLEINAHFRRRREPFWKRMGPEFNDLDFDDSDSDEDEAASQRCYEMTRKAEMDAAC